ncbi:antitoxin [uncultured Cutibacterium sp.]|uniref:antitoxin n=1 Tax=uncultured Cutibacterium sp. TaxID=1912223 RepID=UPI00259A7738|nr:antitoxin [uncultured Cutibacterium sp.]
MGLFDKAKDAVSDHQDDIKNQASQHSDQVEQGIDKAGNTVDDKTGGKFSDQIDKGQDALKDKLGDL